MTNNDEFQKEVSENSSKVLEEFLDNLSKLIKYSLIPIALFISAIVVKHQDILGSFSRPYMFFAGFWAGIIFIFIFQTFSFKINTVNGNIIFKYFLKLSLLILLCSIYFSGVIVAVNKLPNEYTSTNQKIEAKSNK